MTRARLSWRIGGVVSAIEVARARVVLHQQCSAVAHVIEQSLVVFLHVFAGVVGANPEDDGSETLQVAVGSTSLRRNAVTSRPIWRSTVGMSSPAPMM